MKTLITALAAAALMPLAACSKPDDGAANIVVEDPAGNAGTLGNDTTFTSDNVLLPQENATDLNVTDLNTAAPANVTGNTE